jgi:hypothetical protein
MFRVDGRLVTSGQTDDLTLLWSSQDSDPITLNGIPFHQHDAAPPHLMVTKSAAGWNVSHSATRIHFVPDGAQDLPFAS